MPKTDLTFNPDDYALVADRIAIFYQHYPAGRIIPRLHAVTEKAVIFEALIYRDKADAEPAAIGWAREFEGDGEINQVACLENTETSAIGRALANLGFSASKKRPSYEEMAKVARERARQATRETRGGTSRAVRRVREEASSLDDDPLQRDANEVVELLGLVDTAEREGLRPARAQRLRRRLITGSDGPEMLTRIGHHLRHWLAGQRRRRFTLPSDGPTDGGTVA